MSNVINIMCLYWVGDFRGRDFNENDVQRLHDTVAKWIDRPFNFYTLTNDMKAKLPGKKIELKHDWPGWWSKMELHRPNLPEGRTLYLDLDSHIVGELAPLLDTEGDLVMFPARSKGGKTSEGKKQVHRYQAATMLFTANFHTWFYNIFCKNPEGYMKAYRSEQDLMGVMMPDLNTFPKEWLVKMSQLRNKDIPKGTIVITGQPKDTSFRDPKFVPLLNQIAR